MEQSHDGSGNIGARFNHWVEQFYEENTDRVFESAISEFGESPIEDRVTKLTRGVLRKTAEQFSQKEINQFLAAVAEERRYEEVQQFCGQITECQRLWRILTEFGEGDGSSSTVANALEHVVGSRMRRPSGDGLDPVTVLAASAQKSAMALCGE